MDEAWREVTSGKAVGPERLTVKGHHVEVPRAGAGAARFTFAELCARPLGASDYIALAARYHTIFIDDVPKLTERRRNEAKRFITLIDTLYDHAVRLFVSAEAEPGNLMQTRKGTERLRVRPGGLASLRNAEPGLPRRLQGGDRAIESSRRNAHEF